MYLRIWAARLFSFLLLLAGIVAQPAVFAADKINDTASGTLYMRHSADEPVVEALRLATRMQVQVTGNVARVHVVQEFSNTGDDWVEGLYVFPLSRESAVDELLMHIGERTIRGEVHEKAKAQALYAAARAEGRQASIVEQERPNLFTSAVANIAPHAGITIEITYLETLPLRDGRYTLNLPLAITPRYTPGAPQDATGPMPAAAAALMNEASGTTATPERVQAARQHVSIDIDLEPGFALGDVSSLHHAIEMQNSAAGKHVHLQSDTIAADRDFELVWTQADVPAVAGAAFAEQAGGETFALLMLSTPQHVDEVTPPREVTFIIDTSGSMEGPSIEQARAALSMGIDRLKQSDRFNVIRFSSDYSTLFASPQPVNDASRAFASRFIAGLRADGGTEMRAPLENALSSPPRPEFLQQIIFITDGSVGNEAELIGLIHDRIGAQRLFTVGIGAAPNAYFLGEAAAAGRGSYTLIAEREQVGARMRDLFAKLERPSLIDLKVQWPPGMSVDLAEPLPMDLYSGDPVVVLARMPRPATGEVVLSGRVRGVDWTQHLTLSAVGEASGLSKLWARERIAALSRQIHYGGDSETLKASIVELALKHHLVSEFTSLVAVDDAVVRPADSPGHVEQAPTSAPIGGAWATTGFAKTATAADLCLLAGLGCLGFGLLLLVIRYRRASVAGVPA
ncbi:MAG: marine proteobacterial sortase target protein [Gammaproteobacteria bacterium]